MREGTSVDLVVCFFDGDGMSTYFENIRREWGEGNMQEWLNWRGK